jgi:hypothetical protein
MTLLPFLFPLGCSRGHRFPPRQLVVEVACINREQLAPSMLTQLDDSIRPSVQDKTVVHPMPLFLHSHPYHPIRFVVARSLAVTFERRVLVMLALLITRLVPLRVVGCLFFHTRLHLEHVFQWLASLLVRVSMVEQCQYVARMIRAAVFQCPYSAALLTRQLVPFTSINDVIVRNQTIHRVFLFTHTTNIADAILRSGKNAPLWLVATQVVKNNLTRFSRIEGGE